MARNQKEPRVVAELGRPETPEETAARKAKDSRLYRQRKTVNNLVFSLLVSLGLVLVIFLVVPRGTGDFVERSVDVAAAAEQTSPTAGHPLVAPRVPEGWRAKQAELRSSAEHGVSYWYIGYSTADQQHIAVVQAFTTDGSRVPEDWIASELEQQPETGSGTLGGFEWTVYDHRDRSPDGANMLYGMQAEADESTLLVYGTADPETVRALAESVAEEAAAGQALAEQMGTEDGSPGNAPDEDQEIIE